MSDFLPPLNRESVRKALAEFAAVDPNRWAVEPVAEARHVGVIAGKAGKGRRPEDVPESEWLAAWRMADEVRRTELPRGREAQKSFKLKCDALLWGLQERVWMYPAAVKFGLRDGCLRAFARSRGIAYPVR